MDKFRDYIHNNFKLARKSVTFHFKKFAHFFIVIFIIQFLLSTITVSLHTNKLNAENRIKEQYDSHCVFYYMNTNQKYYLKKCATYYFESDHFIDIKSIKEYGSEEQYDYKCDVSILFAEDPAEGLEYFNQKYLPKLEALGPVYMSTTPLYDLENTLFKYDVHYGLYFLIAVVFSTLLLGILYIIRSTGSGFEYGIYTAFGADRKKLFNTSFWELAVISLMTLLPAIICSGIFNYVLAAKSGNVISIGLWDVFLTGFFTLIVITASVYIAISKIARKTPVSLLSARDNSNWVHSPRVSGKIFSQKNTLKMRLLSFRRYCKYYATVTLSSVLFASLFLCGAYCTQLFYEKQETVFPQFRVTYTGNNSYSEEDAEYFLSFDGIVGTYKQESTTAMELNEHILVPNSRTNLTADTVEYDKYSSAFDMVNYFAADSEVVRNLQKSKHTGDLSSVLNSPDTVIISDSYSNSTHFDFNPGDTVSIAFFLKALSEPDTPMHGTDLLEFRLENYLFYYQEVTIGAVIHDESAEFLSLYMSPDLYKKTTGKTPEYKTVDLYVDNKLSSKEIKQLYSDIIRINQLQFRNADNSVYVFTENLNTSFNNTMTKTTELGNKLLAISFFVLAFSVIIWFFAQISFYKRRSNEYILLSAVGYCPRDIRKMFFTDALILSIMSLILYTVFSYILIYAVYYIMNSWLFDYTVRYTFSIPVILYFAGAFITVLSAFLSTFINYTIFKKSKNTVPND
ncbi:MAG: ABC transporter permease [Clostridia bacterium]|nr:ABC transporter permease [Clostridia bacterium]